MNIHPRIIMAILIKEVQDLKKNLNILYMFLIPILLTVLYDRVIPNMPEGFALQFGLLLLVVMVGMYVPSMMIAEEKEKKTIEVLLLSPASSIDVFIGKGLLTLISIFVTGLILMLITGSGFAYLDVIIVGTLATAVFAILLGMTVGLLSPNQMATGIVGTPIYLALILLPQLSMMDIKIVNNIGRLLPTYYYIEMLRESLEKGEHLGSLLYHLAVISAGIIVVFAVLWLVYKKTGLEQK